MNLSNKTFLVRDQGSFQHIAEALVGKVGRVLLFVDYAEDDPSSNRIRIGTGIPGVERICGIMPGKNKGLDFWDVVPEVDCFIFPGNGSGDLQFELRRQGKRVWGSGHGDDLENFRYETKVLLQKLGLPMNHFERIIGIENLKSRLRNESGVKHIKISGARGDTESFCHDGDYRTTEPIIQNFEYRYGSSLLKSYEFILEDDIPDAVETGSDQYSIDGEWPDEILIGNEIKFEGYMLTHRPFKKVDHRITDLLTALSPKLKEYQYRNFFSSEIRVPEKDPQKAIPIDLTARIGSPPGEIIAALVDNLPEVFWYGAERIMVQWKFKAKFGIQATIRSDWAYDKLQSIQIPKELEPWVKFRNYCRADGAYYILPQHIGQSCIGAVVAIGDDPLEIIKTVSERAKQIKGHGIKISLDKIPAMFDAIAKGEKLGIKFSDMKMPDIDAIAKIIT